MHGPPPCPSSALVSFPHHSPSFSCTCHSFRLIILSIHYGLFCTEPLFPLSCISERELFCRSRFSATNRSPPRRFPCMLKRHSVGPVSPWSCLCYFLWHASHHTHIPLAPPPSLSPTIWQAATTINIVPILPGLIHIYGTATRWALSCNLRKVMMSSKVFNAPLQARPACNPLFSRWARMRAPHS